MVKTKKLDHRIKLVLSISLTSILFLILAFFISNCSIMEPETTTLELTMPDSPMVKQINADINLEPLFYHVSGKGPRGYNFDYETVKS